MEGWRAWQHLWRQSDLLRVGGSGISQESLPKIFEPFFTTKQDLGNGLGLWITHDIVTRHGGTIRAESELNAGSNFIFTLPKALYSIE